VEDPHDPFLRITHSPYCRAWVLLNGMSERLDVRTTHDGARYACAFERGDLVERFHRVEDADGTDADAASRLSTALVFRPDPTIFVGG
jgi:DNA gyrase/topoisomerase IV subunit B